MSVSTRDIYTVYCVTKTIDEMMSDRGYQRVYVGDQNVINFTKAMSGLTDSEFHSKLTSAYPNLTLNSLENIKAILYFGLYH